MPKVENKTPTEIECLLQHTSYSQAVIFRGGREPQSTHKMFKPKFIFSTRSTGEKMEQRLSKKPPNLRLIPLKRDNPSLC